MEIFSGEPTIKPIFYEFVDYIIEKYKDKEKKPTIVVPTNMTFILYPDLVDKMEKLIIKGRQNGINIVLSASIDGKFMEQNRPFKVESADKRDDDYYDKVFEFAKKWGIGFHPMVYGENIEKWKLNFLWFQEMFKKHDIPFDAIYLLEVRNAEWTREQMKEFGEFLKFLIKWTFNNIFNGDKEKFVRFLFDRRGYNILNPFSKVGRGLGCSIQSTMFVRLGDLSIVPCHRTSYEKFVYGRFVVKDGKIVDIEALNPELMLAIYSYDAKNSPYCSTCPIKNVCSHGCLGSQYEITGDLFTPIPTVCALEHVKIFSIIEALKEIGVLSIVRNMVHESVKNDIDNVLELMENGWKGPVL